MKYLGVRFVYEGKHIDYIFTGLFSVAMTLILEKC